MAVPDWDAVEAFPAGYGRNALGSMINRIVAGARNARVVAVRCHLDCCAQRLNNVAILRFR
jgi:hypothetical protein